MTDTGHLTDQEHLAVLGRFRDIADARRDEMLASGASVTEQLGSIMGIAERSWEAAVREVESRHWDEIAVYLGV